jgi:magnesium-transporting ATPase (P-type)
MHALIPFDSARKRMSVVAAYLYRDGRRIEEVHLDQPMPHMVALWQANKAAKGRG